MNKKLLLKILYRFHLKKSSPEEKMLVGLFAAGGLLLIAFLVYLIGSAYSSRSVGSILPAGKTALYIEMEEDKIPPKLAGSPLASLLEVGSLLKMVGIQEKNMIPEWARANRGLALIDGKPVLFFRSTSRRKALRFFEHLTLEEERLKKTGPFKMPIYTYPKGQNFVFSFAGPYLFITNQNDVLQTIGQVFQGELPALEKEASYKKAFSNLPQQAWMRGYINVKDLALPNPSGNALFLPLKQFSNAFGWTVRKKQEGFHFNSFLGLDPVVKDLPRRPQAKTGFSYSLSQSLPSENLGIYLGGANLAAEWLNTLAALEDLNPAYGLLLEGMVRAQVEKIFGRDIDLKQNLYPLFEGEYAFIVLAPPEGPLGLELVLRHENKTGMEEKLKRLSEGFKLLAAQFSPKVKVVTLPDGTESRELVADPESLEEAEEPYEGHDLRCLEIKDSAYGFCYAVTESLLMLSNHRQTLKTSLDLLKQKGEALFEYAPFRQGLSQVSKVSDEISFVDIKNLGHLLSRTSWGSLILPYLESLDAITWVKHSFDDGVSTEGFVLIK